MKKLFYDIAPFTYFFVNLDYDMLNNELQSEEQGHFEEIVSGIEMLQRIEFSPKTLQ